MRIAGLVWFIALALVTSANAQTSSQIAQRKPAETYSFFKRTLERLRIGPRAVANAYGEPGDTTEVGLLDCFDAGNYIGRDGHEAERSTLENAATLAFDVLFMQAALQLAGYPRSLWERDVAEYERANLAAVGRYRESSYGWKDPALKRLANKLNRYNKSSNRKYREIVPARECGGGEVEVTIRTSPSAQRIQYINLIKYDLCELQGLDPKGSRCDRWVDYADASGLGAMMSGQYKVRVTWLDGSSEFRDLNVDDLPKSADPKTFAITKQ